MAAPIFAPPSESYSSVEPWFGYRTSRNPVDGKSPRLAARRSPNGISGRGALSGFSSSSSLDAANLGALWSSLLELLPQGVIIVSHSLQPIYWNAKAKDLCQTHLETNLTPGNLPNVISEACHRLLRDSNPASPALFVKDEQSYHASLRISARWLVLTSEQQCSSTMNLAAVMQQAAPTGTDASPDRTCIAIFLEDCDEAMQQEMRIQQKKYDLTEREAEICMLLRKEYTYQEIAKLLQISLNTVKTHVKNIYAKRRSYQGEEKILVL